MIPPIYIPPSDPDFLRILNLRLAMLSGETETSGAVTVAGVAETYSGTHDERIKTYPAERLPAGSTFFESDRGVLYVVSRSGEAHRWKPAGGTMRDTLANKPTDLGTYDSGFLFHATNYLRTWRWTGSAWTYADGQKEAREIIWYPGTLPTGYALCDGSAVTVTTATATTTSFTTPNLVGKFMKGGVYTGSVVSASTPTLTGSTASESSHTHAVDHDHPSFTSGNNTNPGSHNYGTTPSFQFSGDPHTHAIDVPAYTGSSGAGSAHSHAAGTLALSGTAEPTHVLLLPIVKL